MPATSTGGRLASGARRLLDAAAAQDSLDPDVLAGRLRKVGRTAWWLRPLAFVGVAMLGLTGAALTIARNWRLILLAVMPAVWLGAISWQWRRAVLLRDDLPLVHGWVAAATAVLVAAMTAGSYWCSVTFALTVRDPGDPGIRRAFAGARARALWIWAAAGVTATLHIVVVVWVVRMGTWWFALGLGMVALIQMYAFVAVPVLIATGTFVRRSRRDRIRSAAASLGLSGLTATPGLVLNRFGVLLLGLGWFRWFGIALISVAALLQVAGISSATAVKFAGRLAEVDASSDTKH